MAPSFWLALLPLAAVGCLEPKLTLCADGRACAEALVCDEVHHSCVEPDQLTACALSAEAAPCTAGSITGACIDHVCLPPGCGNHVVDPNEQCDDGNQLAGDGCSADCTSTERCGNGVVDLLHGEQCDDGNLISHDGCDSRCQLETLTWETYPIFFNARPVPFMAAFDETRRRLVYLSAPSTWEWDGQQWHVASQSSPAGFTYAVYDPDGQHVVALTTTSIATWDGATWQTSAVAGTPPTGLITGAVYDRIRHAILVFFQNTQAAYLDVTGPSWQAAASPPYTLAYPAFDLSTGHIVAIDGAGHTCEGDGTTWSCVAASPPGMFGWSPFVYDPGRGQVLSVGGSTFGGSIGPVFAWNGSAWVDTTVTVPPRSGAITWSDVANGSVGVSGGLYSTGLGDVLEIHGTTVIDHTPVQPSGLAAISFDPGRDRAVAVGGQGAAWSWDGIWHVLPTTAQPSSVISVAYDPGRGGLVTYDQYTSTVWVLGDDWQAIPVTSTPPLPGDFWSAYDLSAKRLVTVWPTGTWGLAAGDTTWTLVGPGTPANPTSLAYDAGNAQLSALLANTTGGLYDLTGTGWARSLGPGSNYTLTASLARGSLLMIPTTLDVNDVGQIWERRRDAYRALSALPLPPGGMTQMAEVARGRVVIVTHDSIGSLLLTMQFQSSDPDETCAPAEDADGDGLAACDDPDCWWACHPACPYATSCP